MADHPDLDAVDQVRRDALEESRAVYLSPPLAALLRRALPALLRELRAWRDAAAVHPPSPTYSAGPPAGGAP